MAVPTKGTLLAEGVPSCYPLGVKEHTWTREDWMLFLSVLALLVVPPSVLVFFALHEDLFDRLVGLVGGVLGSDLVFLLLAPLIFLGSGFASVFRKGAQSGDSAAVLIAGSSLLGSKKDLL